MFSPQIKSKTYSPLSSPVLTRGMQVSLISCRKSEAWMERYATQSTICWDAKFFSSAVWSSVHSSANGFSVLAHSITSRSWLCNECRMSLWVAFLPLTLKLGGSCLVVYSNLPVSLITDSRRLLIFSSDFISRSRRSFGLSQGSPLTRLDRRVVGILKNELIIHFYKKFRVLRLPRFELGTLW